MDKELLSQLNKLKDIKPDQAWKERNREILLSQISSSVVEENNVFDIIMKKLSLLRYVSQPVMAVFLIVGALLGGGFWSFNVAKDTKPGDSLYIAKIISERTQFALTFNEEDKAKLGIEFAGNRAKEINQVLSEEQNVEEKVAKLKNDFKKEIAGARSRLENINSVKNENINVETVNEDIAADENTEETMVFTAGLGKEEKGIQISESSVPEQVVNNDVVNNTGSTTLVTEVVNEQKETDPQLILEQAKVLLNESNYNETLSKLDQAGEIMDRVSEGEVKGEYEEATASTSIKY